MKDLPIRRFTTVAVYLTEPVAVTVDGFRIGVYTPANMREAISPSPEAFAGLPERRDRQTKEASMDDIARKAIEPDKVKPEGRGKLSKGLGPLPGEPKPTVERDPYKDFRPAPKK